MENRTTRIIISLAVFGLFGYFFYRMFSVEKKVFRSTSNDVDLSLSDTNINYGKMDSNSLKLEGVVAAESDQREVPELPNLVDEKLDDSLNSNSNSNFSQDSDSKSGSGSDNTSMEDSKDSAMTSDTEELSASLEDVSGGLASGKAFINRSSGLTHTLEADLPALEDGNFYEGWLVNPQTDDFISTGKLVTNTEGYWSLYYTNDDAIVGYDFVVVTLETQDDSTPEDHVLEGLAN